MGLDVHLARRQHPMTAQGYTWELWEALKRNHSNLIEHYAGREGALRLAQEYGYGLADSDGLNNLKSTIQGSYGYLCVRFYNFRPPISAKEWLQALHEGLARRKL